MPDKINKFPLGEHTKLLATDQEKWASAEQIRLGRLVEKMHLDLASHKQKQDQESKEVRAYNGLMLKAISANLKAFEKCSLAFGLIPNQSESVLCGQGKMPDAYIRTIFRDWGWQGSNENDIYLEKIAPFLPKSKDARILLLGTGSARLACEIAHLTPANLQCIDSCSLQAGLVDWLLCRKSLKIWDLPSNSLSDPAVKFEIKCPFPRPNNLELFVGNFFENPFEQGFFDLVVAPWFFDILECDYAMALQQCHNWLKEGGKLIHLGLSNFLGASAPYRLRSEEAKKSFSDIFEICFSEQFQSSYLNAPYDGTKTIESIDLHVGEKTIQKHFTICWPPRRPQDFKAPPPEIAQYLRTQNQIEKRILEHLHPGLPIGHDLQKLAASLKVGPQQAAEFAQAFLQQKLSGLGP